MNKSPFPKHTVSHAAQAASPDTQTIRDLDPNVLQRQASRPDASVWVTASAGTGKTKVLTDRVLRLLLPGADERPGTNPAKILCLTFTKAGAGEMALRLTGTLAHWAVMPEEDLTARLKKLQGRESTPADIAAARRLFAQVSDTPGGLKIMTIHSFCQSVLGRFPLEAGIAPHFTPLEDSEAAELLRLARDRVIKRAQNEAGSPLNSAFIRIAATINEDQFFSLIRNIVGEREQMLRLLQDNFGVDGLYRNLCTQLEIPHGLEPAAILQQACEPGSFDEAALRDACRAFAGSSGKKEQAWAIEMQDWLDAAPQTRAAKFPSWKSIFITSEGIPRSNSFPTKPTEKQFPAITTTLRRESDRLLQILEQMNAAACALLTRDLLTLGEAVIAEYQHLKQERAALDFDDLIFKTSKLLTDRASWVLFKLDQGIDHILIDEAQDTNPEQWRLVEALCEEFTEGLGARDIERTIFVVGDEKQSIYSFQRASPLEFARMRAFLRGKVEAAGRAWDDVPLNISFRSAESVLQAVDSVFAAPELQNGVSETPIRHHAWRKGQAGHVELWPIFETPPGDDLDPWSPPTEIIESASGAAMLAGRIAQEIRSWLDRGEMLPSQNRAIRPGDIMILVRTRNAFFNQLAKALKDKNIPVSGSDRMILNEQIAVQDLTAFAQFALQPEDDLTLATILKSPLIGLSEDDLFTLAYDRKGSLWAEILKSGDSSIKTYLQRVMKNARELRPFDFLTSLLHEPCPADNKSGLRAMQRRLGRDILDPLDELLNAALNFESSHAPSLQQFIQWQLHTQSQVKREMQEKGDYVRIMTVHGSKGLQAPIVIMPDTVRNTRGAPAQADRRLLWPDKTGLALPLWSPRADMAFELYSDALRHIDERQDEEYRRLLYVAMTRAEDRLYCAGYKGKKKPLDDSWYFAFENGLRNLDHTETLTDGSLRLTNPQVKDPDKEEKTETAPQASAAIPNWLFSAAPPEISRAAPLRPSQTDDDLEPPVNSPLQPGSSHRFRRGNLTHKLLEILPNLPEPKRESAAKNFLQRFAHDLPAEIQSSIAAETMALLHHPEFAAVFGPGSLAEVPIAGRLTDGREISGQIDRLLVTGSRILIIDYKTNRPPPTDVKNVPPVYRRQMAAYADIIGQIYPGRTISCALLWTGGARLMPLP